MAMYADYMILYGGFSTSSEVFSDCRIFDLRMFAKGWVLNAKGE